ncbi:MAG TPA: FG-GAP-like repeat-containing protein [Bacteroidia bacterium]|nr:FG-GAP-like repeat-containing protein [Bacteroidia bacterium]
MSIRRILLLLFFLDGISVSAQNFNLIDPCEILTDTGYSQGCAWGDYNNDNLIDLFVTNNWTPVNNLFYRNNGDGSFTKITDQIICQEGGHSNGCSWADYNNDGYLDLFVANVNNENNFLYRNDSNFHFTKITGDIACSDSGWSYGCTWGDYDNDGFIDLYVSNYKNQLNYLYHNEHGDHFSKILNSATTQDSCWSQSAVWADFNMDGWLDLFVANYGVNFLFKNNGDGSFTKITTGAIVTDNDNSFGASAADYNNDGLIDLFVANWNGKNCLYKNLTDFTFEKMIIPGMTTDHNNSEGSAWGDYDNDGDKDLFVSNDGIDFLFQNRGGDSFLKIDSIPMCILGPNSNGVAWGDYDGNGFLDMMVVNGGNHTNQLYYNTGNSNHSITVKCVGDISNRSAIGAKLIITADIFGEEVQQLYEISSQSGGGYGSQNSMQTVVGLGDATFVKSLRVIWPSGKITERTHLGSDSFYTMYEHDSLLFNPNPSLQIFNNPASETFSISGYSTDKFSPVELTLYTITGQKAVTFSEHSGLLGDFTFQIKRGESRLARGIYLFQLSVDEHLLSGKIILF